MNSMNHQEIAERLLEMKERADYDPLVAEYLSKAELPENLEYVRPEQTGRRGGYFRKKPRRDSLKQLKHRVKFSKTAYDQFGTKGTAVLKDGRTIAKIAEIIGDELRGTGVTKDPKEKERERLIKILESKETTTKRVQASWI